MKKTAAIISACMLFTSCNKDEVITEEVGGQPIIETDNDTGMISYKDANGNKQQINRTDVKEMVELDQ